MLVYQIVRFRNGKEVVTDLEADSYKHESSKTVTLFRGDQAVGTFYDVDHVRAIRTGTIQLDPEVASSLNGLIKKTSKETIEDDDEYDSVYPFICP